MSNENDKNEFKIVVYVREFTVNEDVVSIRSKQFPPEATHPTSSGRYHKPGEVTYYHGSGLNTACAEKYGDPTAPIDPNDVVCQIPSGTYNLCDAQALIAACPKYARILSDQSEGGWDVGQELRSELQQAGCSGLFVPSTQLPGAMNLVVWPLDGKQLPAGSFLLKPRSNTND